MGFIIRDSFGSYQGTVQAVGKKVQNVLESELQAILMALQHAWSRSYMKVTVEKQLTSSIVKFFILMDIIGHEKLYSRVENWNNAIYMDKQKLKSGGR